MIFLEKERGLVKINKTNSDYENNEFRTQCT